MVRDVGESGVKGSICLLLRICLLLSLSLPPISFPSFSSSSVFGLSFELHLYLTALHVISICGFVELLSLPVIFDDPTDRSCFSIIQIVPTSSLLSLHPHALYCTCIFGCPSSKHKHESRAQILLVDLSFLCTVRAWCPFIFFD